MMPPFKQITFAGCREVLLLLLEEIGVFKTVSLAVVTFYIIPLLASLNTSINYMILYPETRVGVTYGEALILVVISAIAIFAFVILWLYYIDLFVAAVVRLFGGCKESDKPGNI